MYQLLCEYEFEGKPWEKHELYWQRSPIAHITDVETPMLLTHGKCGTAADAEIFWFWRSFWTPT